MSIMPLLFLLQGSATPGVYTPSGELPIPPLHRQAEAAAPSKEQQKRAECMQLAEIDAESAGDLASEWLVAGGGIYARECIATAYALQGEWRLAAQGFAAAANDALVAKDTQAAIYWAQAGNAALAGNDGATALEMFDAALAQGTLTGEPLGELQLDRARALVALGRSDAARGALDAAKLAAPSDALVWLLSATLARRMDNLGLAQDDILTAATLDPRNPDIGLEAGNIAISAGNDAVARKSWAQVLLVAPDSAAAVTAKGYIAQLDAIAAPVLPIEAVE